MKLRDYRQMYDRWWRQFMRACDVWHRGGGNVDRGMRPLRRYAEMAG